MPARTVLHFMNLYTMTKISLRPCAWTYSPAYSLGCNIISYRLYYRGNVNILLEGKMMGRVSRPKK